MQKSKRKHLYTFVKVTVSIALLYAVLIQIDWEFVREQWNKSNPIWIAIGILSYVISQIVSAFRMQLFLKSIKIEISDVKAFKMYALGMFYNLFIPGGIGGDAYKVILLKKHFSNSYQSIAKAVFLDRVTGLCAIISLIFFGVSILPVPIIEVYRVPIIALTILSLVLFPILFGFLFKTFKAVAYHSFSLSIIIQALQIGTIIAGMLALGLKLNYIIYAVIFLISSILSVISFSGIGIREAFFFYASKYAYVNPDISATLAIYFSLVTIFISFFGIIYTIKKIKI